MKKLGDTGKPISLLKIKFSSSDPKLQKSRLLQNSYENSFKILLENAFLESNSCKNLARFAFYCSECYKQGINPTFFCISCLKKIERLHKKTNCTRKMIQFPILEHLDLKFSKCLIFIMSIVWRYCCKAFAYNIRALCGVIASKRAISSTLSSLLTSWNGLGKKWNR